MLQEGQLQQFEAYCEKLYTSPDANERAAAEAALVQLSSSSEYIPQCQFVLDLGRKKPPIHPTLYCRTKSQARNTYFFSKPD